MADDYEQFQIDRKIKLEQIEKIPKDQLEKRPTDENVNFQPKVSNNGVVKVRQTPTKEKDRSKTKKTESKNTESSSELVCRAIVDELVDLTVKGRQSPIVISIDSDDEEIVEKDPLSLSDTETKKSTSKNKKVSNTFRRNSVFSVDVPSPCSTITICSESEEEDERPLSNLSRKKSSKKRPSRAGYRLVNSLSELQNVTRCFVKLDRNAVSRYIATKGPKPIVRLKRCRVPQKPVEQISNKSSNFKEKQSHKAKNSEKTSTDVIKNSTKSFLTIGTPAQSPNVKKTIKEEGNVKRVSKSILKTTSHPVVILSPIKTERSNIGSTTVFSRSIVSSTKIVIVDNKTFPTINDVSRSVGVPSNNGDVDVEPNRSSSTNDVHLNVQCPTNDVHLKVQCPTNDVHLKVQCPRNYVTSRALLTEVSATEIDNLLSITDGEKENF